MTGSHDIIISLASNHGHEENLQQARLRLRQILFDCRFTATIRTAPFGTQQQATDDGSETFYLNQLLYARTTLTATELTHALKDIEQQMGRTPDEKAIGKVRIDLDLMKWDSELFHLNDWHRPYITQLLGKAEDKPEQY